jgi:hypothetical protein
MLAMATGINAQGNNTDVGGADDNHKSLAEHIFKFKKKSDALNVYLNYASSFRAMDPDGHWSTSFKTKHARIEILGNITDKLSYRFRYRVNQHNAVGSEDYVSKPTDLLMVGYQPNDKLSIEVGRICQNWGGFEYYENPIYIYQYSDMVGHMDIFMEGVNVSYKVTPTQEIAMNITNTYSDKFNVEYGDNPVLVSRAQKASRLEAAHHPLTYIFLWSGNFLNNLLQMRWSWGLQTQAKGQYGNMVALGQKLNLPSFQWYIDYMGEFDGIDRIGIATKDLGDYVADGLMGDPRFGHVHYHSLITKANWQFAPKWNLMLKGTYETASVTKIEKFKNYRKSIGYLASMEYYPIPSQDLRLFLAYIGHKYDFSNKCGLKDNNTNCIELGLIYRIKAF